MLSRLLFCFCVSSPLLLPAQAPEQAPPEAAVKPFEKANRCLKEFQTNLEQLDQKLADAVQKRIDKETEPTLKSEWEAQLAAFLNQRVLPVCEPSAVDDYQKKRRKAVVVCSNELKRLVDLYSKDMAGYAEEVAEISELKEAWAWDDLRVEFARSTTKADSPWRLVRGAIEGVGKVGSVGKIPLPSEQHSDGGEKPKGYIPWWNAEFDLRLQFQRIPGEGDGDLYIAVPIREDGSAQRQLLVKIGSSSVSIVGSNHSLPNAGFGSGDLAEILFSVRKGTLQLTADNETLEVKTKGLKLPEGTKFLDTGSILLQPSVGSRFRVTAAEVIKVDPKAPVVTWTSTLPPKDSKDEFWLGRVWYGTITWDNGKTNRARVRVAHRSGSRIRLDMTIGSRTWKIMCKLTGNDPNSFELGDAKTDGRRLGSEKGSGGVNGGKLHWQFGWQRDFGRHDRSVTTIFSTRG
ncbi:MAG: hypothetical protein JNK49_10790 [Planctomycetes bacterium]|nr:hypothetical protein [Planctomycetota bacterium]